jgi:hypothetical protein
MLHPNLESQDQKTLEALEFYCSHTAQIEVVRHDRSLGEACQELWWGMTEV